MDKAIHSVTGRRPADPTSGTKAVTARKTEHAAEAFAATVALRSDQLETHPTTPLSLKSTPAVARSRPQAPWRRSPALWIAGGSGALVLLLATLVFFIQTKDGAIRVEINDPSLEVAIRGTEIVLKQADQGHDVRLSPGEKTLIVQRGDFRFETDKLVLKRGDAVTVQVTLLAGKVEVRQGKQLLGESRLPVMEQRTSGQDVRARRNGVSTPRSSAVSPRLRRPTMWKLPAHWPTWLTG